MDCRDTYKIFFGIFDRKPSCTEVPFSIKAGWWGLAGLCRYREFTKLVGTQSKHQYQDASPRTTIIAASLPRQIPEPHGILLIWLEINFIFYLDPQTQSQI